MLGTAHNTQGIREGDRCPRPRMARILIQAGRNPCRQLIEARAVTSNAAPCTACLNTVLAAKGRYSVMVEADTLRAIW